MLSVEKITTLEGFTVLGAEWNELLARSVANTITLRHEWLTTWWDIFGEGRELCIILVRDNGTLIGIAPLLKRRIMQFGLPLHRLEFLASGEDQADEICSDYLDFILKKGREDEAFAAIFSFLNEDHSWDEISLKEIPASSPTFAALSKECETGSIKCEIENDGESVFLPLNQTWESLVESRSRKLRSQIRYEERKAQAIENTFHVVQDESSWDEAFAIFMKLHQSVWTARGEPGVFASEKFTRFHQQLAAKLLPLGFMRLFQLRCQDQTVASLYVFIYDNKALFYQSGFAADSPVHSPGNVVRHKAIQHSMNEGLSEWDFLKAEPDSYKYRWSQHTRPLKKVRIAKPQAKEAMRATAHNVVDGLRRIKRALKK
jgi:CelD/BcsL family acetyltransferase involved in cellulose biosynthesis